MGAMGTMAVQGVERVEMRAGLEVLVEVVVRLGDKVAWAAAGVICELGRSRCRSGETR